MDLRYWRTASGYEVDFVLGDMDLAVEVKSGVRVHTGDLTGLRALSEEHRVKHRVVVSLERQSRIVEPGIETVPWRTFLTRLWADDFALGR